MKSRILTSTHHTCIKKHTHTPTIDITKVGSVYYAFDTTQSKIVKNSFAQLWYLDSHVDMTAP